MMKSLRSWLCVLIAMLFLLSATACGVLNNPPQQTETTTTPRSAETTAAETQDDDGETEDPYMDDDQDIADPDDDADEQDNDTSRPPEGGPDSITDYYSIETAYQLAELVEEFHFTYTSEDAGGTAAVSTYEFSRLDEGMIDGKQAYLIRLTRQDDSSEGSVQAWVTSRDGVAAGAEGEELSDNDAAALTVRVSTYIQPFIPTVMWSSVLASSQMQTVMRWQLNEESTRTADFGSGPVSLLCLKYDIGSDSLYMELLAIDEKGFFTYYEQTSGDKTYTFETLYLKP